MNRKQLVALVAAMTITLPMMSLAQNAPAPASQAQMFLAAKLSLDQARAIAVKEAPGTVASIGFNDENGRGVYEATVVADNGTETLLKIDADTGAILGKGLASVMGDSENGDGETGGEGQGTESNG